MTIHTIIPGVFKLDGGATFGVVPKTLWSKVYPADENNLCYFTIRLLLIETGNRIILIDTGMGNKQPEDFYRHYYREGHHSIEMALNEAGFSPADVTDVLFTHLHFDHVGGALNRTKEGNIIPAFPNARYHVSKRQWEWAVNPNQREKASYLSENILPLKNLHLIHFIETEGEYFPGIQLRFFHGHTDGLIVLFIHYKDKTLVYTNDLLALSVQIPSSWVCGYDTRPLLSFEERNSFLEEAASNNYYLVFQHDYYIECCTLQKTEKGIRLKQTFKLSDILLKD